VTDVRELSLGPSMLGKLPQTWKTIWCLVFDKLDQAPRLVRRVSAREREVVAMST